MGQGNLLDGGRNCGSQAHEELVACLTALTHSSPEDDIDHIPALERPLVALISISRSSDGRAMLAKLKTIYLLVEALDHLHKRCQLSDFSLKLTGILLLLLKLTRNLCAGDSTNQDAFLEAGGVAVLAPIARSLLSISRHKYRSVSGPSDAAVQNDSVLERMKGRFGTISDSPEVIYEQGNFSVLEMMLQLLGNFARRGEASQAAVWEEFFPNILLELSALRVKEICEPLCMLLYTSCQSNTKRCLQLSQDDGAALIALILAVTMMYNDSDAFDNAASSNGEIQWCELLVQQICLEEPLFPLLFANLGSPPLSQQVQYSKVNTDELLTVCQLSLGTASLTSVQASLLYILCDLLCNQQAGSVNVSVGGDGDGQHCARSPMPLKSIAFLADILRRAAECSAENAELMSMPTLLSSSPSTQILGFALSLLRTLCAWDASNDDHIKLSTVLLSHGLIDLLLDLLEALGPPAVSGRKSIAEGRVHPGVTTFPYKNLYLGYRRDIVAVIANASHQNVLVQERVREKGSLILVLQQCVVENENPFLREWGLWAMRNLLEGNEKNQEEISGLEAKEPVNLPELGRMGLNVDIDPDTRRPRLVNDP